MEFGGDMGTQAITKELMDILKDMLKYVIVLTNQNQIQMMIIKQQVQVMMKKKKKIYYLV